MWAAFSAALAASAVLGAAVAPRLFDWQPALAWREPWRWWTAAFVHLSAAHLAANLAGCAVVGAFGWAARATRRDTAAWTVAWPLTHLMLMAQPDLARYGGLSGVLHAGVAVAATGLVARDDGRRRWVGGAVLAGLFAKILTERPWGAALQQWAGWDIAIAPLAHATGLAAGVLCAMVAWATARTRPTETMRR